MNNVNKDAELQALVARVSAMSADQFNACLIARSQYQDDFNDWLQYVDEADFNSDDDDPIPDAESFLDFGELDILDDIREAMRIALAKAKQEGSSADEIDLRQHVYTENLYDLLIDDLLASHNITAAMYDDVVQVDEAVYHGSFSWSSIEGAGKDLALAEQMTHKG